VWDNCSQTDNDRLEKLQLEAARIVTGLTAYLSWVSLYQENGGEQLSHTTQEYSNKDLIKVKQTFSRISK
jgi:hypothetical protein